jgi:hypothetical protein
MTKNEIFQSAIIEKLDRIIDLLTSITTLEMIDSCKERNPMEVPRSEFINFAHGVTTVDQLRREKELQKQLESKGKSQ